MLVAADKEGCEVRQLPGLIGADRRHRYGDLVFLGNVDVLLLASSKVSPKVSYRNEGRGPQ